MDGDTGSLDGPVVDAAALAGLLAEPARRRVVAALVLGASTIDEIRVATGLDAREIGTALSRLVEGELVVRGSGGDHHLLDEAFVAAARASRPARSGDTGVDADVSEDAARVLRAFVRDGKLVSIPTQRAKRLVILDVLAQEFEPGRRYSEREVNATLRAWHDDTAALRRYLVDDEFLEREQGVYWRAGGRFDVD
jgi:hypothetical protein